MGASTMSGTDMDGVFMLE